MEEEGGDRGVLLASAICGTLFSLLSAASFSILWTVNWRPWRIYSWIFARKWPNFLHGPQLHLLCGFLNLSAWFVVVSPIMVLIIWGSWLIVILNRDLIGLAVIMAGTALLLAFYSIMLWWRTQWQSSRAVAILLLLAVALLCAYELCAVYVTTGSRASDRYSPSGFFFRVSAIALAINMLFICRMIFNGNGLDVDEYVRRAYNLLIPIALKWVLWLVCLNHQSRTSYILGNLEGLPILYFFILARYLFWWYTPSCMV